MILQYIRNLNLETKMVPLQSNVAILTETESVPCRQRGCDMRRLYETTIVNF